MQLILARRDACPRVRIPSDRWVPLLGRFEGQRRRRARRRHAQIEARRYSPRRARRGKRRPTSPSRASAVALERHLLEPAAATRASRSGRRLRRLAIRRRETPSSARPATRLSALGDRLRLGRKNVRVFRGGADGLVVRVGIGVGSAASHRLQFERASDGSAAAGGAWLFGEAPALSSATCARRSAASHRLQFRRGGVFILVAGDIVRPGVAFGACGGAARANVREGRGQLGRGRLRGLDDGGQRLDVRGRGVVDAGRFQLGRRRDFGGGALDGRLRRRGVEGGGGQMLSFRPLRATRRGGVQIRGDVRRVPALFRGARRRRATKLRREGRRERVGREAGAGTANPVVRGRVRPRSPRDFPKTEEDLRQREARFRRDRGRTSSSPMARSRVRRRYSSRLRIAPLVHTPTPDRRGAVRRRRGA